MLSLLQECYYYCCCINIIVATAIALRVTLHEDYIYHMHVTTIITASIKVYIPDINWSICNTAQLWLLWSLVTPTWSPQLSNPICGCCMNVTFAACLSWPQHTKNIFRHLMKHYCGHINVITAVSLRVPLLNDLPRVRRLAEYCAMLCDALRYCAMLCDMQPHDIPKHCCMKVMAPACLLLLLLLLLNYNFAACMLFAIALRVITASADGHVLTVAFM